MRHRRLDARAHVGSRASPASSTGSSRGRLPTRTGRAYLLRTTLAPKFQAEIVVFLVVGLRWRCSCERSRALVAERASRAARGATSARYFSPKAVDVLAERDEPLGRVRRQAGQRALRGSRRLHDHGRRDVARGRDGDAARFHGRMEEEVFRYGGWLRVVHRRCAAFATFGVPDRDRARDATDACVRPRHSRGAGSVEPERARRRSAPIRMGPGMHYGPVWRATSAASASMAFADRGTRTQRHEPAPGARTRDLDATIVASGALVAAVERERADVTLLEGLKPRGPHDAARARRCRSTLRLGSL